MIYDTAQSGDYQGGAAFSDDRRYRYSLYRRWSRPTVRDDDRTVLFVGLNPSIADALIDSRTLRRMTSFSQSWGAHRLVVGNLFAYRAQDPRELLRADDPVGPENDQALLDLIDESHLIVAAWGALGTHRRRADRVVDLLGQCDRCVVHCFGVTQNRQPRHPLYLRRDAPLSVYCKGRILQSEGAYAARL